MNWRFGTEKDADRASGRIEAAAVLPRLEEGEVHLMEVYTVSIRERGDEDMDIWTSAFSTRELAEEFAKKAKERLAGYSMEDEWQISIDSAELNDEMYLDWIDSRYEDYEQ